MADDTKKRGAQDRARIDVSQRHERRYWSDKLGCEEEELVRAVEQVGPMADDVKRHLGRT